MRFFAIAISGAPAAFTSKGGTPIVAGAQFCSVIDSGQGMGFRNDPSALRVQFHIELKPSHTAEPKSFVRIYGPSLDMLGQASDLKKLPIKIYGGFWGGGDNKYALPLAVEEAPYAGLLVSGTILTAMGNWIGNEMTLDIFIAGGGGAPKGGPETPGAATSGSAESGGPGGAPTPRMARMRGRQRSIGRPQRFLRAPISPDQFDDNPLAGITGDLQTLINTISSFASGGWLQTPLNLIHNMMPGMPLDSVLTQALNTAFPNSQVVSLIKGGLTIGFQDAGFYQTLGQYAGYVKNLSKNIVSGGIGGALSSIGGAASGLGGLVGGTVGSELGSIGSLASSAGGLANKLGIGGGAANNYDGIQIFPVKDMLILYDGDKAFGNIKLKFWDLIGQPTWVKPGLINFMTPMRADIFPSMKVTMPEQALQGIKPDVGNVVGPGSNLPRSLEITFAGDFTVQTVMVVGDSRHPAGTSWALSVNAAGTAATDTGFTSSETPGAATSGGATSGGPSGAPTPGMVLHGNPAMQRQMLRNRQWR